MSGGHDDHAGGSGEKHGFLTIEGLQKNWWKYATIPGVIIFLVGACTTSNWVNRQSLKKEEKFAATQPVLPSNPAHQASTPTDKPSAGQDAQKALVDGVQTAADASSVANESLRTHLLNFARRGDAFAGDPNDPSWMDPHPPTTGWTDVSAPPVTDPSHPDSDVNWSPWIRMHKGYGFNPTPNFPSSQYRLQYMVRWTGGKELKILEANDFGKDEASAVRLQSTSSEPLTMKVSFEAGYKQ